MGDDVITDAMIKAGRDAWDSNMGGNPSHVLRAIYKAMRRAEALDRLSPNLEGERP